METVQLVLVEERHEIREIAGRTKTGKDYESSSLRGILASVERHLSRSSYNKTIFKDSDFKEKKK